MMTKMTVFGGWFCLASKVKGSGLRLGEPGPGGGKGEGQCPFPPANRILVVVRSPASALLRFSALLVVWVRVWLSTMYLYVYVYMCVYVYVYVFVLVI